jgi:micrococcal nuclease
MKHARAVGLSLWLLAHGAAADCKLDKGPERTVARVLDGETVELDDGTRVRLAGILAPRARDAGVADGRWPPEAAAKAALDALVTAKAVRLQFDTTRRDRHGNTLAHLVRADDSEGPSVQEQLLANGHARVDAIEGQRRCIDSLLIAENVARAAGRGLWTEPAYRVRAAVPSRDIAAYQGTFQIITATVARIETGRGVTRMILGDDRRRDLTLAIRATDRETAGPLGGDLKILVGRQAEVRGWLTQRAFGGPEIDVSLAGHIRLLDGPAPSSPRRRGTP